MPWWWPFGKKKAQQARKQLAQSKAAAAKNFCAQPPRKPEQACIDPVRKEPPCDLSKLQLEVKKDKTNVLVINADPSKEAKKQRTFTVVRAGTQESGQLSSGQVVEVVAGKKGDPVKTRVHVSVETDLKYCSSRGHPMLECTEVGALSQPLRSTRKKEFQVWRVARPADNCESLSKLIASWWVFDTAPNIFTVTASTCGHRPSGPITRKLSTVVHVYPDDQYSLLIKLPPKNKAKRSTTQSAYVDDGLHLETIRKVGGETTRDRKSPPRKSKKSTKGAPRDGSIAKALLGTGAEKPKFRLELKHNGQMVDSVAKFSEIIGAIVNLQRSISSILDTIKDLKPQVGWSFDVEMALFEGSLAASWGWREHSDQRAFLGYKIMAELTLIDASISVSFGIDVSFWVLQLTAKISGELGAEFYLKGTAERTSPDKALPRGFALVIGGESYAKLEVAIVVLRPGWVEARGHVKTGIDMVGGLRIKPKDGVYVDFEVEWTGIELFATAKLPLMGRKEGKIEIFEKRTLLQDRFPPAATSTGSNGT